MIKRWQESALRRNLAVRRGVHLTGARQVGKSTLAEYVAKVNMRHLALDDPMYLRAAKDDPITFVDRKDGKTLVIDEIQKAPELLNAIKTKVDHDNSRGQYLITGSSNLHFVKAVSDSLAGRLGRVRLRTMALGELEGGRGDFLRCAFARDFPQSVEALDKRDVIHLAFAGGYPEPMEFDYRSRVAWYREYLDDLLKKDIRDVTEIRKLDSLRKVARWLFSYSTKFFDIKDMCAASGIGRETAETYISVLKALYVVDEIPPWTDGDYAKLGKRPKYCAADSGLVANTLGWDESSVYYDDDCCGKLIETWVCHELSALVDLNEGCELSQYRDGDGHEIDFIVKGANGKMLGIEVKSGAVGKDDFKHLKWFISRFSPQQFTGIVLYSGKDVLSFGDAMLAVPLGALAL
jgi:hypothetical protein